MLFLHLADLKLVAEALRTQIERQNSRLAEIRKLRRQWATMLPSGSRHLMQTWRSSAASIYVGSARSLPMSRPDAFAILLTRFASQRRAD